MLTKTINGKTFAVKKIDGKEHIVQIDQFDIDEERAANAMRRINQFRCIPKRGRKAGFGKACNHPNASAVGHA